MNIDWTDALFTPRERGRYLVTREYRAGVGPSERRGVERRVEIGQFTPGPGWCDGETGRVVAWSPLPGPAGVGRASGVSS